MKLQIGQTLGSFTVTQYDEVPYRNLGVWTLRHVSGATLFYSDRNDGQFLFAIGFMTLPADNTGVFHIIEHACLDGSDAYPLREPFVNLLKTSMYTDLNAGTWNDMTVYHFGSINEKDYRNMMSVYLDAVFHPAFLHDRRIFEKEAWRPEPDGEGGLCRNGVVLNEMQAAENDRDSILWNGLYRALFPHTPYAFSAGGASAEIPLLTYEAFCDTYRRFYRPDNCALFLCGDMDLENHLSYIDSVLQALPSHKLPAPDKPVPQTPLCAPQAVEYCCLPDGESESDNTTLALAYVLPADKNSLLPFSLRLLREYLVGSLESPLSRAILDAGIGKDPDMTVDYDALQPTLVFSVKKANPQSAETFERLVRQTVEQLVREGIDSRRMLDRMRAWEYTARESALEPQQAIYAGFGIMREYFRYGTYEAQDYPAEIRKLCADAPYWESVLQKSILENPHFALLRCIPSSAMAGERTAKRAEEYAALRAAMSDSAYDALCGYHAAFRTYLETPDSPEAEATLPRLSLADLHTERKKAVVCAATALVGEDPVPFLSVATADTAELCQISLSFDIGDLEEQGLREVFLLGLTLPSLGTTRLSPDALRARQRELCCRFDLYHAICAQTANRCRPALILNISCPISNVSPVLSLAGELLTDAVYDETYMYRALSAYYAGRKNDLIGAGHMTALSVASASLCRVGAYMRLLDGGIDNVRYLETVLADCEESGAHREKEKETVDRGNAASLTAAVKACASRVFCTTRLTVSVATEQSGIPICRQAISALHLPKGSRSPNTSLALAPRKNRAFRIPADVGYCVQMGVQDTEKTPFDPIDSLIGQWLSSTYLWDEVRAKGGAYGSGQFASGDGRIAFWSYRDPHVRETYDSFAAAADWIDANTPDEEALTALIIKAVADYAKPLSEFGYADKAFRDYFIGRDPDRDDREIERLLAARPSDFHAYADKLRRLMPETVCVALGREDLLRESNLFADVESLS